MKQFGGHELTAALAEARGGGQSLWHGKRAVWLFDADLDRLALTARGLKVPVKIRRPGQEGQCVEVPKEAVGRAIERCGELL